MPASPSRHVTMVGSQTPTSAAPPYPSSSQKYEAGDDKEDEEDEHDGKRGDFDVDMVV